MHIWKIGKTLTKHHYHRKEKEDFYIQSNMENIIHADYTYTKRVCKDFEIKNFGEYRNFMLKVMHYC